MLLSLLVAGLTAYSKAKQHRKHYIYILNDAATSWQWLIQIRARQFEMQFVLLVPQESLAMLRTCPYRLVCRKVLLWTHMYMQKGSVGNGGNLEPRSRACPDRPDRQGKKKGGILKAGPPMSCQLDIDMICNVEKPQLTRTWFPWTQVCRSRGTMAKSG